MLANLAIVFDFDLTLADSRPAFLDCHHFAARHMGWPEQPGRMIYGLMGNPLPQIIRTMYPQAADAEAGAYETAYQQRADEVMTGLTRLLPGVADALVSLHNSGYGLGIVSQKLRYRIEEFVASKGLASLFGAIIGPEDAPDFKPDPRGLLMALQRLGSAPDAGVYVGDHRIDGETAHRAGTGFIAVLSGETQAVEFAPFKPLGILDSVAGLPELLATLREVAR